MLRLGFNERDEKRGSDMQPHLFIGNRNYSSWSLRAWLCLRWAGIEFDETLIDLDQPGYGECRIAEVLAVSPTGMVPVLRLGDESVWDTLAIAEWAAENTRSAALLPGDPLARAQVRSTVGEMHAGFGGLRRELSMNIRRRCRASGLSPAAQADIGRIDRMWATLRERHAARGPYLFGERSLADAFYLPVATRMRTYGVTLSAVAQAYGEMLLADADFLHWEALVLAEPAKPLLRADTDKLYCDATCSPASEP